MNIKAIIVSLLLLCPSFSVSLSAFASAFDSWNEEYTREVTTQTEEQMLHVVADAIVEPTDTKLILDQDRNIIGMNAYRSGEKESYLVKDLTKGIVLFKISGRDVVKLSSKNFDPSHGGALEMVYIYNGLSNTYRTFPVELHREGDKWVLYVNEQTGRRSFTTMSVKVNRILGQPVGIKQITVK